MTSLLNPLNRLRGAMALAAALAFLPLTASLHSAQAQPSRYAPAYGYRSRRVVRRTPVRTYRRTYSSTYRRTPVRSYRSTPARNYRSSRTYRTYRAPATRTRVITRYRR